MKIKLEEITAVAVGGTFVEIDVDEETSIENTCSILDEDGDEAMEDVNPTMSFTGKDGQKYAVSLTSVNAFRLKK